MSRPELTARLRARGFLAAEHPTEQQFGSALDRASAFLLGVTAPNAQSDRALQRALEGAECGFPDAITQGGVALWGLQTPRPVRLWVDPQLPSLTPATWRSLVREACDRVSDCCALTFEIVDDSRLANHVIVPAQIDGPSRVLADCELPYGSELARPTRMRIDVSEGWSASRAVRMVYALDVLVHEGGHRDGLPHVSAAEALCIMNPLLNPALLAELQPRDVAEYRQRYGMKPATVPVGPGRVLTITGGRAEVSAPGLTPSVLTLGDAGVLRVAFSVDSRLDVPGYRVSRMG